MSLPIDECLSDAPLLPLLAAANMARTGYKALQKNNTKPVALQGMLAPTIGNHMPRVRSAFRGSEASESALTRREVQAMIDQAIRAYDALPSDEVVLSMDGQLYEPIQRMKVSAVRAPRNGGVRKQGASPMVVAKPSAPAPLYTAGRKKRRGKLDSALNQGGGNAAQQQNGFVVLHESTARSLGEHSVVRDRTSSSTPLWLIVDDAVLHAAAKFGCRFLIDSGSPLSLFPNRVRQELNLEEMRVSKLSVGGVSTEVTFAKFLSKTTGFWAKDYVVIGMDHMTVRGLPKLARVFAPSDSLPCSAMLDTAAVDNLISEQLLTHLSAQGEVFVEGPSKHVNGVLRPAWDCNGTTFTCYTKDGPLVQPSGFRIAKRSSPREWSPLLKQWDVHLHFFEPGVAMKPATRWTMSDLGLVTADQWPKFCPDCAVIEDPNAWWQALERICASDDDCECSLSPNEAMHACVVEGESSSDDDEPVLAGADATPIASKVDTLAKQVFKPLDAKMYSTPMPDGFGHKVAVRFESAPDLSAVAFTYGATTKQFLGCGMLPTAFGLCTLGSRGTGLYPVISYAERAGVLEPVGIDPRSFVAVPSTAVALGGATVSLGSFYPATCYNANRTKLAMITTLKDANGMDVRAPVGATAPMSGYALGAPLSATTSGTNRLVVELGASSVDAGSTLTETGSVTVTLYAVTTAGVLASSSVTATIKEDLISRNMIFAINPNAVFGGDCLLDHIEVSFTAGPSNAQIQITRLVAYSGTQTGNTLPTDEISKSFPFAYWDCAPIPNFSSYLGAGFTGAQLQSASMLFSNTTAPNYVTGDTNTFIVPGGDPGVTGIVPKILSTLPGNVNRPFAVGAYAVAQQTAFNNKNAITMSRFAPPVGDLGPSAWMVAEITNPPSGTLLTGRVVFSGVFEVQTTNPTFGTVNTLCDNALLQDLINAAPNEVNSENPRHGKRVRSAYKRLRELLSSRGVALTNRQRAAFLR